MKEIPLINWKEWWIVALRKKKRTKIEDNDNHFDLYFKKYNESRSQKYQDLRESDRSYNNKECNKSRGKENPIHDLSKSGSRERLNRSKYL